jgi:enterochelin esterase-like enzyme
LVVMPLAYGNMQILAGGWQASRKPNWHQVHDDSFNKFYDSLLNEIIPLVESNYRVSANRAARAIAGLSMGGEQSLVFGLNAPMPFAWIGAFSSGGLKTDFDTLFPHLDDKVNGRLRLLWIACGKDDGLFESNLKFEEWLNTKGVVHTWVAAPGRHSFLVWRRCLAEFAPLLFEGKK